MVRCLIDQMNLAGVSEQLSIDCSSDCSIAQNRVMSNRPPFRGALLVITRLLHLLNSPAANQDNKWGRPAC
jgi:hypothetical protein